MLVPQNLLSYTRRQRNVLVYKAGRHCSLLAVQCVFTSVAVGDNVICVPHDREREMHVRVREAPAQENIDLVVE